MKTRRILNGIAVLLGASVTLLMVAYGLAHASEGDRMLGVVCSKGCLALEVPGQIGADREIVVDRVVVPDDSWVAVNLTGMGGMPGRLIGAVHVRAGESAHVRVPIEPDAELTEDVIVVVHADRGVPGRFEFDADRFESSPDKPYYAGGEEYSRSVGVRFSTGGNTF